MKIFFFAVLCLSFASTGYAASNIEYCASPQAWAAQLTVAKLRNNGFAPQPLPKVELVAQQKLTSTHLLPASKDFGDLYSQTLLITVASSKPEHSNKRFIVHTIISDYECSMAEPIIIDDSLWDGFANNSPSP